jgi:hypothetical protein
MSSKYVGVSFNKSSPMHWRAQGCLHSKTVDLGYHATELAAAQAYDQWAKDYAGKKLNFFESTPHISSKYRGVSWEKYKQCWMACISLNNKTVRLGYHATELAAAQAYDQQAKKYARKLNFREYSSGNSF